jgi:4-hydroxy-4-methyl-2-oxoglutarate aldolase
MTEPNDALDRELVEAARTLPAATLHEAAGKRGALPSAIKPLVPETELCGPAYTVTCPAADNLWLHRALDRVQPGDVLVAYTQGHYEAGYWGDLLTAAAQYRNVAGLVIDGCVRDGKEIAEVGFPVFARGRCIRGTKKDASGPGALGEVVRIGEVEVKPGDLVRGDGDGVVVIPSGEVAAAVAAAETREAAEADVRARIARGERTIDLLGLP